MSTPTLWHIPYQRNPYFTGREDILSQLHRALQADATVAISHPQGISGLGGIGKTQTALEYAYRHRTEYNAVFWVRADSVAVLTSSLVEIAHILQLPERDEQDQEIIVQAVLYWFRCHADWLLIYDNIDDLSVAEPFLPKAGAGHLLFTTRAHALGGVAQRLDIQKMEPEIGALLLLRRASLLVVQETLNMAKPSEQSIACTISQELDGLPLALDQAGAYIKEVHCSLPSYLERYQTRRRDILQERGSFNQDYPASVATTWSLSFEKVSQVNPAAAELLDFCAFLAPDEIPEEMITGGALHLGPQLEHVVADLVLFDQSIAALLAYSLIARNADNEMLSIHRLVQAVLRDGMPAEEAKQWVERTVQAVSEACPSVEFATWPQWERYLPHAQTCAELIEERHMELPGAASLFHLAGSYLIERARYREAKPLLQQALTIREHHLGPEHPHTANTLDRLARVYRDQGKYAQAEPLLKHALAICEQQLGADHHSTASSLNNLALLYKNQGKYGQAESLYLRALAIDKKALRAEHPGIATGFNNLALLYKNQGKYGQAESLYLRALAIYEQQLGTDHPDTATILNNLACLYRSQDKYEHAEPLYLQALLIREQQLGPQHPDTATSLNNLALFYDDQGKYKQAEPLYLRALLIREQQLGPQHPDTASSLNNLALLYKNQGKYEQAEPLYLRALAIDKKALGAEHPGVATNLSNLASLYDNQGKYKRAESLYLRALVIREQQLGPQHPSTATSLDNLASLYDDQGKYKQAEPLYLRALVIREQQLGPQHPDTASSLNNLALLYDNQGKYNKAELLYARALTILKQSLGLQHPNTQITQRNYATLLQAMGRDDEAKQMEEKQ